MCLMFMYLIFIDGLVIRFIIKLFSYAYIPKKVYMLFAYVKYLIQFQYQ